VPEALTWYRLFAERESEYMLSRKIASRTRSKARHPFSIRRHFEKTSGGILDCEVSVEHSRHRLSKLPPLTFSIHSSTSCRLNAAPVSP
jgi:hypothetical protein